MNEKGKMSPLNYIGIFYPKKGFGRFLGLPFILPAALAAVNIIFTLLIKSSGDEALQEFLILQAFIASCGIPVLTVLTDVIREWSATAGFGGKSPRRLLLLRSAPHMERAVKWAFAADEIRRFAVYIIICAMAGTGAAVTGHHGSAGGIVKAMALTAAVMYLGAVIAVLFVRFIDSHTIMFLVTYFWLMIIGMVGMAIQSGVLSGDIPGAVTWLFLIPGAAAGVLCCKEAITRASSCRYADRKK